MLRSILIFASQVFSISATKNVFPHSFFENDGDWASFVEIVKANVPSK